MTDLILKSANDHEIRFLLTSYLDAVRHGDGQNGLAESITTLPLTGEADVNRRVAALLTELDAASKRLDDRGCDRIKEALRIFATASDRLHCIAANHEKAVTKDIRPRP